MLAIDTNIVVRYLTNDHPEQSALARTIVEGEAVFAAVTVMLETEWALRSAYGYGPAQVVGALRAFGGLSTVTVEDAATVSSALDLAETGMDFADALHLRKAAGLDGFITFDRKLIARAKAEGHAA